VPHSRRQLEPTRGGYGYQIVYVGKNIFSLIRRLSDKIIISDLSDRQTLYKNIRVFNLSFLGRCKLYLRAISNSEVGKNTRIGYPVV
jgi:hypothetical protein